MIKFDLSEILEQSGLSIFTNDIQSLLYTLSVQTTNYLAYSGNLRTGVKPDEGQLISNLPYPDATKEFISRAILLEQNSNEDALSAVYTDTVFQLLVASGYLPIGWLSLTKSADIKFDQLKESWDMIVSGSVNATSTEFIYTRVKSFGMVIRKVVGHDEDDLLYFLIPVTNADREYLTSWVNNLHIRNVIIMDETTYATYLVDKNYTFLFKFDSVVSTYDGVTFRAKVKLTESVPTYLISIGCDQKCVFLDKGDSDKYEIVNSHYRTIEVKRNEPIDLTVSIPQNYVIDFVSIDGYMYFVGDGDIGAVGISVSEVSDTVINGYKIYDVIIRGISSSSKVYIGACEDLTGKPATFKVISTKRSAIEVREEDVTINLIFNDPFIYFNRNCIHVYARKDDESEVEEIDTFAIMVDGQSYRERKAVFGVTAFPHGDHVEVKPEFPPKPMYTGFVHRNNPYEKSYLSRRRHMNVPMEAKPESRAILYGVSECGSIIISISGYTDYKYFGVSFDDRALITHHKVPGRMDDGVDMIPVIESINFVNEPKEETTSTGDNNSETNVDTSEVSGGEDNVTPTEPSEDSGKIETDESDNKDDSSDNQNSTEESSSKEEPSTTEGDSDKNSEEKSDAESV
jgi:hypothetical protein